MYGVGAFRDGGHAYNDGNMTAGEALSLTNSVKPRSLPIKRGGIARGENSTSRRAILTSWCIPETGIMRAGDSRRVMK